MVNTGLGDNNPPSLLLRAMRMLKFLMRTPEKGAETAVFLASSPDAADVTGKYWADCHEKRARNISYDRGASAPSLGYQRDHDGVGLTSKFPLLTTVLL